ncbi:MAG: hypothetical protein SAJ12_23300 [Jaaginema sp. PMC 1079.18]|nr:hypothetical protein [Jaaginema sp. PMC 1080.18]MEC4853919.1 hypothetical protein [Jaaginema sp. PMC 1079.18]MEC4866130.1 hypothetical protein [Jaaginema sp. PMC 1078.18]
MQIIEQYQDKVVLSFRHSIITYLFISIGLAVVGSSFVITSLFFIQRDEGVWVLFCGMGIVLVTGGAFWLSKFPKIKIFTFDKSQNCLFMEQRSFQNQPNQKIFEIPLFCIVGVEVSSSFGDAEIPTSYYPNLILDSVYWRIRLSSDGRHDVAVKIAKLISQFLNISYFPDESKAPLPIWKQKALEEAAPYQFHWQYFKKEIERLQKYVSQYPLDAQSYQKLGVLMSYDRKASITYLKQAEHLFEAQKDNESAALSRVLQYFVTWYD